MKNKLLIFHVIFLCLSLQGCGLISRAVKIESMPHHVHERPERVVNAYFAECDGQEDEFLLIILNGISSSSVSRREFVYKIPRSVLRKDCSNKNKWCLDNKINNKYVGHQYVVPRENIYIGTNIPSCISKKEIQFYTQRSDGGGSQKYIRKIHRKSNSKELVFGSYFIRGDKRHNQLSLTHSYYDGNYYYFTSISAESVIKSNPSIIYILPLAYVADVVTFPFQAIYCMFDPDKCFPFYH